ncbi:MAG TPA: peptidylprolyl isomerase [Candidatus Angelobacter sp.]
MLRKSHLLLIAFLLLAVCLYADNIVDEIVARVNSSIITRADLERGKQQNEEDLKQRFPSDWQTKWADRQKDLLRDLIDRQLLVEKGKDLGITGETEMIKRLNELRQQFGLGTMEELEKAAQQQGVSYEDFKEQIRTEIVTSKVIGQEVGSHVAREINQAEVQKFYDQHQKELALPEEVSLAEILVSTQPPKPPTDDKNKDAAQNVQLPSDPAKVAEAEAKANELLDQLHKGAKFDELAKKSSDGTTAAQGGAIGDFKRGEMDKELEDKIFALKAGELTGVIHTKPGFIIFKVLAHQPGGIPALKDVDNKIRDAIYVQKLEPAARAYLTKLREESYIDIKPGYVDTGASPNQTKPVIVAANTNGDEIKQAKKKKKKHLLIF